MRERQCRKLEYPKGRAPPSCFQLNNMSSVSTAHFVTRLSH